MYGGKAESTQNHIAQEYKQEVMNAEEEE